MKEDDKRLRPMWKMFYGHPSKGWKNVFLGKLKKLGFSKPFFSRVLWAPVGVWRQHGISVCDVVVQQRRRDWKNWRQGQELWQLTHLTRSLRSPKIATQKYTIQQWNMYQCTTLPRKQLQTEACNKNNKVPKNGLFFCTPALVLPICSINYVWIYWVNSAFHPSR